MLREKVEAVGKMQEYIKAHINDPITLYDLAQTCDFSPWYASRIFKELIGKTPSTLELLEYLKLP
jgi:AraC family transcriptional regulator